MVGKVLEDEVLFQSNASPALDEPVGLGMLPHFFCHLLQRRGSLGQVDAHLKIPPEATL
ncbi:MAG: hypothetical protein J7L75_04270 [Thermoproteales archaeon]|nr:hypothetical protein [Thermoproteales archaeon]